jgi:hypothetical protein
VGRRPLSVHHSAGRWGPIGDWESNSSQIASVAVGTAMVRRVRREEQQHHLRRQLCLPHLRDEPQGHTRHEQQNGRWSRPARVRPRPEARPPVGGGNAGSHSACWRASKINNDLDAGKLDEVSANTRHHNRGYTMPTADAEPHQRRERLADTSAARIELARLPDRA